MSHNRLRHTSRTYTKKMKANARMLCHGCFFTILWIWLKCQLIYLFFCIYVEINFNKQFGIRKTNALCRRYSNNSFDITLVFQLTAERNPLDLIMASCFLSMSVELTPFVLVRPWSGLFDNAGIVDEWVNSLKSNLFPPSTTWLLLFFILLLLKIRK